MMETLMHAVAVREPGHVELVQLPVPTPGDYEALVKSEVAYICNATKSDRSHVVL